MGCREWRSGAGSGAPDDVLSGDGGPEEPSSGKNKPEQRVDLGNDVVLGGVVPEDHVLPGGGDEEDVASFNATPTSVIALLVHP